MGALADELQLHRLVGFDSSPFIYQFENAPLFADITTAAFDALAAGSIRGITSTLTLLEIIVRLLQLGRQDIADHYERLVGAVPNLEIVDISRPVMRRAAELRAAHEWRLADALQIAACVSAGATAFLTNDRRLRDVPGLRILALADFVDTT